MFDTQIFLGEFIGTGLLMLLGVGVNAAVTLKHSKAQGAGWIVITVGWGFAVMTAVYITAPLSGAHINPAVTVGVAIKSGDWSQVPLYFAAQIAGAATGAALAWLAYLGQFNRNEAPSLGMFSTGPEVRNSFQNVITEAIGTFVLVYFVLAIGDNQGLVANSTSGLMVAFVVMGIGMSLGGPTGYAINPARDLGPRIMHTILPIPNKGTSDWGYAWIPIVGPVIGAAAAAHLYLYVH